MPFNYKLFAVNTVVVCFIGLHVVWFAASVPPRSNGRILSGQDTEWCFAVWGLSK